MNKPFYKSTGVMGAVASIVGCLVALLASLASLKGLEITPENQALIVSLVMTLGGGVAALVGRLKAADAIGAGSLDVPARSFRSAVEPVRPFPGPPEDDACPTCRTKFGAHVLGCPESCAVPVQKVESQGIDLQSALTRLADVVEALNAKSAPGIQPFVKDQAGFPGPVAEGKPVGESGPVITNG